jgi:competence protein ComGC
MPVLHSSISKKLYFAGTVSVTISGIRMDTKMGKKKKSKRLSAVEIVIILVIIAVLIPFAVPKIKEGRINGKVFRTASDLRTLAMALNDYSVEHDAFPPALIPYITDETGDITIYVDGKFRPYTLLDMFSIGDVALPHYYAWDGKWAAWSPGPDGDVDIVPEQDLRGTSKEILQNLRLKEYNSTNGTISDGDIYWLY